MERMWTAEASMKYPKQWIVMVNVTCDDIVFKGYETYRHMGDVYLVTSDADEAIEKSIALEKDGSFGNTTVVEGFDDRPQIGGLEWASL